MPIAALERQVESLTLSIFVILDSCSTHAICARIQPGDAIHDAVGIQQSDRRHERFGVTAAFNRPTWLPLAMRKTITRSWLQVCETRCFRFYPRKFSRGKIRNIDIEATMREVSFRRNKVSIFAAPLANWTRAHKISPHFSSSPAGSTTRRGVHLKHGDYSNWFENAIKDSELAKAARQIERSSITA